MTVGPVGVDYLGSGLLALSLANDEAVSSFQKLSGIIHDGGAKAWVQLFHAGAYSHPILIDGKEPMAPSAVFSNYSRVTPREMTLEDIHEVQDGLSRQGSAPKPPDLTVLKSLPPPATWFPSFYRLSQFADDA